MLCPVQSRENAEILLSYANRKLDPDTAAVLERHMAVCSECRRVAEAQQAVWSALDAWEAESVSPDFDRRLYTRIEAGEGTGWWRRFVAPLRPMSWKPVMSLAAAGMTLLAVLLIRTPDSATPVPQRFETVEAEQVERSLEDLEMLRQLSMPPHYRAEAGERSL